MATLDHPTLADLLLWQSGELSSERAETLSRHLAECEECQARIEELESLYGDIGFVGDQDAQFRFHEALQEKRQPFWRKFRIAPAWMAATASAVIVALLLVTFIEYAPSAQAETLLGRAIKEESTENGNAHILKIHSSGMDCNIVFRRAAAVVSASDSNQDFCGQLTANLHQAGWSWNDLLSARSFKQWRDGLKEKKDGISKLPDITEVTTTTTSGPLHRATLRLRTTDYHAVQARFVFASTVGVEQPEFEVTESRDVPQEIAKVELAPIHANQRPELHSASLPAVDPMDEAETDVRLALHRLGADRNVLLTVHREPDSIKVSGIVPGFQTAPIANSLAGLPHVETRIVSEGQDLPSTGWQNFHGDAPPLAYEQINTLYLNDSPGRRRFINNLDALTLRLVGEARTREGLCALVKQPQSPSRIAQLNTALADIDANMKADLGSISSLLEPLIGPTKSQARPLTYAQAAELYTLVHELVSMNKSDNPVGLGETFDWVRLVISGR